MNALAKLQIGSVYRTHAFGDCVLRKLPIHRETNQIVGELKQMDGTEVIHVKLDYLLSLKSV
jgi:hypothetical protein